MKISGHGPDISRPRSILFALFRHSQPSPLVTTAFCLRAAQQCCSIITFLHFRIIGILHTSIEPALSVGCAVGSGSGLGSITDQPPSPGVPPVASFLWRRLTTGAGPTLLAAVTLAKERAILRFFGEASPGRGAPSHRPTAVLPPSRP